MRTSMLTALNHCWFAAYPGRAFAVRLVPREEASRWIRPPGDDEIPCCITNADKHRDVLAVFGQSLAEGCGSLPAEARGTQS